MLKEHWLFTVAGLSPLDSLLVHILCGSHERSGSISTNSISLDHFLHEQSARGVASILPPHIRSAYLTRSKTISVAFLRVFQYWTFIGLLLGPLCMCLLGTVQSQWPLMDMAMFFKKTPIPPPDRTARKSPESDTCLQPLEEIKTVTYLFYNCWSSSCGCRHVFHNWPSISFKPTSPLWRNLLPLYNFRRGHVEV